MKLVSVIVPVYNVEAYIEETVKSILAQTYENFEVLIIDDESPDRSVEIVQQFDDPRIRIIRQKNRGLAGARNTGVRHAKGDYLAFLDSDDLWLPDKLEKHVAHLDSSPEVGLSFSQSEFIDVHGDSLGIFQMPKLTDITASHLMCRNPIGNGSAPVIRKEVFPEIRFDSDLHGEMEDFYFDEHFRQSEDIECWIRIAIQTNWQIEGIPYALTLYRVNAEGLSANIMKQYESWCAVIDKNRDSDPELFKAWESTARAFQLRYLARRAVRLKDGKMGLELTLKALKTQPKIAILEPRKTGLTFAAAFMLWSLPFSLYPKIEAKALDVVGWFQKRKIARDQKNQAQSLSA